VSRCTFVNAPPPPVLTIVSTGDDNGGIDVDDDKVQAEDVGIEETVLEYE